MSELRYNSVSADTLESLARLQVVLMAPSHPGNIGATARGMATMGLENLVLVGGVDHLCDEAMRRSSGNEVMLQNARRVASLDEALDDTHFVAGTTARPRHVQGKAISLPAFAAEIAALPRNQKVSILFGTERSGLTNDEIGRCKRLVYIPTSTTFSSLNLGSAVQVVTYALRAAHETLSHLDYDRRLEPPATAGDMARMLVHLEETLDRIGFLQYDGPRERVLARMRKMYTRMAPDDREVRLLRGFLSRIRIAVERAERGLVIRGPKPTPEELARAPISAPTSIQGTESDAKLEAGPDAAE